MRRDARAGILRTALEALDARFGLGLELVQRDIGLATLEREGTTLPADVIESARAADGVILGPVATYEYPPPEDGGLNPSAEIRKRLDLYANVRPSRGRPGVPALAPDMDLVVVRENTEGFYADRNMFSGPGEFQPTDDMALAVRKITARASRRIAEVAFGLARQRRNSVTVFHKANVLKVSDGLFLSEVRKSWERYPDVALDEVLVDAMAAMLVRRPGAYDVVLTTNMFGDILSDEASELAGGLGLAASVNAGEAHVVAQAVHGSAPDIAGKGIANPAALMLSAGMLLEWLATRRHSADLGAAAGHLQGAVDAVLSDPANHTPDLGGSATTGQFADAVTRAIAEREPG